MLRRHPAGRRAGREQAARLTGELAARRPASTPWRASRSASARRWAAHFPVNSHRLSLPDHRRQAVHCRPADLRRPSARGHVERRHRPSQRGVSTTLLGRPARTPEPAIRDGQDTPGGEPGRLNDRSVLGALALCFAAIAALSWKKWGVPEIDAGAELTTADMISTAPSPIRTSPTTTAPSASTPWPLPSRSWDQLHRGIRLRAG